MWNPSGFSHLNNRIQSLYFKVKLQTTDLSSDRFTLLTGCSQALAGREGSPQPSSTRPSPTGHLCSITGMLSEQLLLELWMAGDDTWIICPSVTRDQQKHWSYWLGQHHCTAPGWGICIILYSLWFWSFPQINLFRLGLKHPPNTCWSSTHTSFLVLFLIPFPFQPQPGWQQQTRCASAEGWLEQRRLWNTPVLHWHWHTDRAQQSFAGSASSPSHRKDQPVLFAPQLLRAGVPTVCSWDVFSGVGTGIQRCN